MLAMDSRLGDFGRGVLIEDLVRAVEDRDRAGVVAMLDEPSTKVAASLRSWIVDRQVNNA